MFSYFVSTTHSVQWQRSQCTSYEASQEVFSGESKRPNYAKL